MRVRTALESSASARFAAAIASGNASCGSTTRPRASCMPSRCRRMRAHTVNPRTAACLNVSSRLPERGFELASSSSSPRSTSSCAGRRRRVRAAERVGAGVQLETQLARDRARDVVLHREQIVRRAVERLRPRADAVARANEHRVHAKSASRLPNRSLEQIGDVELLADVARVDRFSLEREGRRAWRDAKPGNLGERADQIVRDAVGEILLRRVAADVRERQHRDGLRSWLPRGHTAKIATPIAATAVTNVMYHAHAGIRAFVDGATRLTGAAVGARLAAARGETPPARPQTADALRDPSQAAHDERGEIRRQIRATAVRTSAGCLRELRRQQQMRRTSGERRSAGDQLVRETSDRVDVDALIHRVVARDLFRRHVRRRADRETGLRQLAAAAVRR